MKPNALVGCLMTLALMPLLMPPAQAAELIQLSPAQISAAAIQTQKPQTTHGQAGQMVLQGTVVLPSQASDVISAPLAGVVQSIQVSPGQMVRAGSPVATLMSPQLIEWQRDWLHAETQAQLSAERLQRDEALFAEGIIAELRVRESRAQQRMAQVSLDEKRQALQLAGVTPAQMRQRTLDARLTLVAPAGGTVLALDATPGQRLEAGMPVARLARSGPLSIELQASQQQLPALNVGDALQVDGCKAPARLSAITPQVSSSTQGTLLRAEFSAKENCLRLNQFVQLRARAHTDGSLSLPSSAVTQRDGQNYIFVRRPKGFEPVQVRVSPASGERVVVESGLSASDDVAVQGLAALKGAWQGLGAEAESKGP
jgi:RND family efflux transporter MFP subunit